MLEVTDKALVIQLQEGNLEALGALYDRHRRLVYRTALAITGDADSAADLLQDVFLRLNRFSRNIDPLRPLEPWLYRMTTNLSYDWVKRRKRWPRPLEDLADWLIGSVKNSPYEVVEKNDEWSRVQRAVAALPLPQRVVVVLYYLNDLALQEIAEILDVPIGTVKSRLYYGRLGLKRSLGLEQDLVPDLQFEQT
ncbi:MAG TPA: RNA polymerase sigma factor [Anaerolineales bacterium]